MELRPYQAKDEVESRTTEVEVWHNENANIEVLKKGLYADESENELAEDEKKLRAESRQVWSADNTFMWNWDGINDKVKKLAKYRQPNLVTRGLAEQYHALLSPPLAASCGHRCVNALAKQAEAQERTIHRLGRHHGTYYGTENSTHPEGITAENIDHILRLIGEVPFKMACCRCYNAKAWFGLEAPSSITTNTPTFPGMTVEQLAQNPNLDVSHLRVNRGQWTQVCNSPAYYASVINHRKLDKHFNTEHLGWHAGLMRPRFRYREQDGYGDFISRRPQWWSNIRLADNKAVISGLHSPQRFLCPNCLTAAKGLPAHLYWMARGYSVKEAKHLLMKEQAIVQGRTNNGRWLKNTALDIKDYKRLGPLYA
tara:strand:+ start:100 stop:1206 length:1107 start_codon:yes stop_codon:yes gene_type:complete